MYQNWHRSRLKSCQDRPQSTSVSWLKLFLLLLNLYIYIYITNLFYSLSLLFFSRHNRSRSARQVNSGQSVNRRSNCSLQKRKREKHHNQVGLRQCQNLQMRFGSVSPTLVLQIGGQQQARRVSVWQTQLQRQIQAPPPHLVRRLSRPRHSHGYHVERRRCHGRRTVAHW